MPDFLAESKAMRDSDWKIAAQPADLLDRRVEITGPTDRKMVINALNCGASTFMADFEDANCPTWDNMIDGPDRTCATRCGAPSPSSRTASTTA